MLQPLLQNAQVITKCRNPYYKMRHYYKMLQNTHAMLKVRETIFAPKCGTSGTRRRGDYENYAGGWCLAVRLVGTVYAFAVYLSGKRAFCKQNAMLLQTFKRSAYPKTKH